MKKFLIPLFALSVLLAGCGKTTDTAANGGASSSVQTGPFGFNGAMLSGKHTAVIKTSLGNITVELDANAAPKSVTNFVTLAKAGYYNGLLFYRVIPDLSVETGDPNNDGTGGVSVFGQTFPDEMSAAAYGLDKHTLGEIAAGRPLTGPLEGKEDTTVQQYYESMGYAYDNKLPSIPMKRGALVMANSGPNTNGSRFFITQVDTPYMEGKYTVFGKVTEGMEVIDAMTKIEIGENDKPATDVTISGVDVQN